MTTRDTRCEELTIMLRDVERELGFDDHDYDGRVTLAAMAVQIRDLRANFERVGVEYATTSVGVV